MNKKLLGILILVIVIIACYFVFDLQKPGTDINVYAERISDNSTELYIVSEIIDSNDNVIDTDFGKITIELADNQSNSISFTELPIENGKTVIRADGDGFDHVNVNYNGGYFLKPSDTSGLLKIKNTTTLTDENLTQIY